MMLRDKRFILITLLMALVAANFWAGSRVPALNEKALMGGDTQVNALGFETVLQVDPTDPVITRSLYTTVNWMETNRKGMTFGIIFGAILMLMVSLMKKKSVESGFGNTLIGMMIGAPLGVCVNCAAPIAKGLYSGGARMETMLAAMVSSPTLNVIVLTMLFSLYPMYVVAIKLGLTFAFILIVIPLACRWLYPDIVLGDKAETALAGEAVCALPVNDPPPVSWLAAVRWVLINFLERLWYVVRKTVPLMFLAGFLGSLVITLLPWESLADVAPDTGTTKALILMAGIALIGVSLPVPISFDILIPAILMAAGMPMDYVMILLFTLGIFSIYPFFIIWNAIGKKMALAMTVVLVGFGLAAGAMGEILFERDLDRQRGLFYNVFATDGKSRGPTVPAEVDVSTAQSDSELFPRLAAHRLVPEPVSGIESELEVESIPFLPQQAESSRGFTRLLGAELGLDDQAGLSILSFVSLSRFRAIATGDVHNDGWPDILLASGGDLVLYANQGGTGFLRQVVDVDEVDDLHIANAALVDLNNDSWLDIYLSSYRAGNFVIYNREGSFSGTRIQVFPNHEDAIMTASTTFGDIDRDGDLDAALGNYTLGTLAGRGSSKAAMNVLVYNHADGFHTNPLPGGAGETQSILFSDINSDGALDLMVANDFTPADYIYLGDGAGSMKMLERGNELVPHTTWSTMSLATADVDNDLLPEIYIGQITGFSGNGAIERRGIEEQTCQEFGNGVVKERCSEVMNIQRNIVRGRQMKDPFRCMTDDEHYQEDCIAVLLLTSALRWNRDPGLCELYPESWELFSFICRQSFREVVVLNEEEKITVLPQIRGKNSLMKRDKAGFPYHDVATDMGVETGGWTWNSKFADLDNDEWQDLYIVNGEFNSATRESNIFYHNKEGKEFKDATAEFGLASYLATSSFSYVDLDNDGDLDIIALPSWGPASIYLNGAGGQNAITFEVRDAVGNHFGIGTKIIIHYGPGGGRAQVRELKAGGGFVSYDAPSAHFGLGDYDGVSHVEIYWSTGEHSELRGKLSAGARYIITRKKSAGTRTTIVESSGEADLQRVDDNADGKGS